MLTNLMDKRAGFLSAAGGARLPADVGGVAAQSEMPNRTSFSEVPAARVPRFGDSRRTEAAKLVGIKQESRSMSRGSIKGAIDMGLAEELTLAEAVKPLMAFRYISFDVVGTMIDFETVMEDGLPSSRPRLGSSPSPTISFAH